MVNKADLADKAHSEVDDKEAKDDRADEQYVVNKKLFDT